MVKNESGLKSDKKRHVKLVRNDDNMRRYNWLIYMLFAIYINKRESSLVGQDFSHFTTCHSVL